MTHRDQLRPRCEHIAEGVEPQLPQFVDVEDSYSSAGGVRDPDPWHQVRRVFGDRQQHLVARLQMRAPPTVRDEIDGLCRATSEDDIEQIISVEKLRYRRPRIAQRSSSA